MTTPHPHQETATQQIRVQAPPPPQQQPAPQPAVPPQQAWQGAPPPGAYAVPPGDAVEKAHFGHALASEWTKIRSVRSTMWTLGVMLLLVVGVGLLTALAMSTSEYVTEPILSGGLFGLLFGQIAVITLGVLVVTSEYGTGMIRTTMTACPQRGRVLLAKSVVFFLVAFVPTTLACSLVAVVNWALLKDKPVPSFFGGSSPMADSLVDGRLVATAGEWLGATVGAGLFVALLGLLSLAVGAMLRHTAGAVTTMLGVVLLPIIVSLFLFGESTRSLRENLQGYSPLNGLASLYRVPLQGDGDGWTLLGLLAALTAAALIGAYGLLTKRDV
jgi:hypothetical protein